MSTVEKLSKHKSISKVKLIGSQSRLGYNANVKLILDSHDQLNLRKICSAT
ncbi:MAG: hypothetical protein LBE18_04590 [Planctomycetaceae bacterium]|nr:hypothetical protein [Planctomycetaceae bacterium]